MIDKSNAKKDRMKKMRINYRPTFTKCNYRCEYCYVNERTRAKGMDAGRFYEIIDKIISLPYSINIRIACNGEPFLSKDILSGMVKLSKASNIENLETVTNLSVSKLQLKEFLDEIDKSKFALTITLHFSQVKSITDFYEKIEILKENEIPFTVGGVAYPPLLKKIIEYKKIFENEYNTIFFVNKFDGIFQGKTYPESYNWLEKRILKKLIYSKFEYEHTMKQEKTRGKLCSAGKDFIHIIDSGNVLRCNAEKTCLGNILNDRINFFDEYLPCNAEYCSCPYMSLNLLNFINQYHHGRSFRAYVAKAGN